MSERKARGHFISQLAEASKASPLTDSLGRDDLRKLLIELLIQTQGCLPYIAKIDGEDCIYIGAIEERFLPTLEKMIGGLKKGPAMKIEPFEEPFPYDKDDIGRDVIGLYRREKTD